MTQPTNNNKFDFNISYTKSILDDNSKLENVWSALLRIVTKVVAFAVIFPLEAIFKNAYILGTDLYANWNDRKVEVLSTPVNSTTTTAVSTPKSLIDVTHSPRKSPKLTISIPTTPVSSRGSSSVASSGASSLASPTMIITDATESDSEPSSPVAHTTETRFVLVNEPTVTERPVEETRIVLYTEPTTEDPEIQVEDNSNPEIEIPTTEGGYNWKKVAAYAAGVAALIGAGAYYLYNRPTAVVENAPTLENMCSNFCGTVCPSMVQLGNAGNSTGAVLCSAGTTVAKHVSQFKSVVNKVLNPLLAIAAPILPVNATQYIPTQSLLQFAATMEHN